MLIKIESIKNILFIILCVFIFSFPRHYQVLKLLLLSSLLLVQMLSDLRTSIKINSWILIWYVLYLAFALTWSFIGLINKNPGIKDAFRLEFIWILMLFIFTIFLHLDVETIQKSLYTSAFFSSIIGLYCIFGSTFGQFFLLEWINPYEGAVNRFDGIIRTTLPSISLMSFLFPVIIFIKLPEKKSKKIIRIAIILFSFLFIILSGRRIVQLIGILALLYFSFSNIKRVNVKVVLPILSLGIVLFWINYRYKFIDFKFYFEVYFQDKFQNFQSDLRFKQLIEFWKYTKENFLFGVGFGKGIPSIVRDIEKPWRYELTYSLYLYQTGILGFSLFIGLFISLFCKLKKYHSNLGKALSIGLLFYLIASATNPYINSGFDYKFPILIIMLFISYESKQHNLLNT